MLHALATDHSDREIWWLHGARSSRDHSFAAEARALLASLPNVRTHVCYSRPRPNDLEGRDFDSAGRLTASLLAELEPPRNAEAYLCGPTPFMEEISAGLAAIGVGGTDIHTEPFGPAPGLTPGIAATPTRTPTHPPANAEAARRSSSRAATSRSRGATTTRACSNSPKHATYPSVGRAAPASATTARRRSSQAPSTTTPTQSNPPPTAAHSSAAHSRTTTWCSICDRQPPGQGALISRQARISGSESGSTTGSRPSEALGASAVRPAPDLPSSSQAYLVADVGPPALRGKPGSLLAGGSAPPGGKVRSLGGCRRLSPGDP